MPILKFSAYTCVQGFRCSQMWYEHKLFPRMFVILEMPMCLFSVPIITIGVGPLWVSLSSQFKKFKILNFCNMCTVPFHYSKVFVVVVFFFIIYGLNTFIFKRWICFFFCLKPSKMILAIALSVIFLTFRHSSFCCT